MPPANHHAITVYAGIVLVLACTLVLGAALRVFDKAPPVTAVKERTVR